MIIELLVFLIPVGNIINVVSVVIKTIIIVFAFHLLAFVLYEIGKIVIKKICKD